MSFNKTEPAKEKGTPPVAKARVGSVTASIWENPGEKGVFYSATFERRYRDKEGNYKSSDSYGPSDLLELAAAATRAHGKILDHLESKAEDTAA